eukprot:780313_1
MASRKRTMGHGLSCNDPNNKRKSTKRKHFLSVEQHTKLPRYHVLDPQIDSGRYVDTTHRSDAMHHVKEFISSLPTILLTVSLLIVTPIRCQYFITADDSHCLTIGTNSFTNNSQVFWTNISYSSHCINWALEDHFNRETQSIYNGKLFVNGFGANPVNQATYLNQRLYVDDTDFRFTKAQSRLPTSQTAQSVGYDSTNNIIELVGGSPDGSLYVQYSIDSDNFTIIGHPFTYYQRSFGQAYTQIGGVLYTGRGFKFDVVTDSYSTSGGDVHWRFGCLATIDDNSIFFAGYGSGTANRRTRVYNVLSNTFAEGPSLQALHVQGTCQIVNHYLFAIGGNNGSVETRSIEKLYVDISNLNLYSFKYLTQSLIESGQEASWDARSEVVGNNIFIQRRGTHVIQVLDTVTDTISIIGDLNAIGVHFGSIVANNIWYLFGVSNGTSSRDLWFYDFSADTDVNIDDNMKANGVDEFEFDLNQNTLMNKKYASDSINCTLGMSANDTTFALDENTTINGYVARFDCTNSGIVTLRSISIAYQPTAAPTTAPTRTGETIPPSRMPSEAPTFNPFTILIDSSGIDNDACGSIISPCGTMAFACALSMFSEAFTNVSKIYFYITGQNEQEIFAWENDGKTSTDVSFLNDMRGPAWYSPCTFYREFSEFDKDVEITFDPIKIRSMKDWFPDACAQNWHWYRLFFQRRTADTIFNNLIISDLDMDQMHGLQMLLACGSGHRLVLNNCIFSNIHRSYWPADGSSYVAVIRVNSLSTIFNTSFHNIVLNPSQSNLSDFEEYYDEVPAFIQISSYEIISTAAISFHMQHCSIVNYTNLGGPFIQHYASNVYSDTRQLEIYNSSFSSIFTSSALIISSSFLKQWRVVINIISCDFLDVNLGSILITQNAHSVLITDTSISSKQLIKDLTELNTEHSSLSLFVFGNDDVIMKNITLKYHYDTRVNCEPLEEETWGEVSLFQFKCYAPIQFLQSEGVVNMTGFIVSNDIEYNTMQELYTCSKFKQCEFTVHESDFDYALLNNAGELIVNDFFIRGVGIHAQLLLNKGDAFIYNAITEYTYYHTSFDPFTINIHILFRNDGLSICGGVLEIHNSFLYGASYVAVHVTKGSVSISNSVIQASQTAVDASPDVTSLIIDNVQFLNIGSFYTSYLSIIISPTIIPPILISAKQTVIKNSYFSFFDKHGMIICSPELWAHILSYELSPSDQAIYDLTLINNSFELSTNNTLITIQEAEVIIDLIGSMTDDMESLEIASSRLETLRWNASALFQFGCIICIYPDTTLQMIGNTFYENQLSDTTPFISIDNAPYTSCLSNNIMYGYALQLFSGTVTSCNKYNMIASLDAAESTCWTGSLGQMTDTYGFNLNDTDYFIATRTQNMNNLPLISLESNDSVFAAERISFVKQTNDDTIDHAIDVVSGTLFLFDIDLNEMMDISYHANCDVSCFERLNASADKLLQVNMKCGNYLDDNGTQYNALSLMSDAMQSFKDHWSAAIIELRPSSTYYPGGKLYLNYSIFDSFGNQVYDYDQHITLTLKSDPLKLNLQIVAHIDSNGECDVCKQGIYIQNINTQHIGNVSIISTEMHTQELEARDIVFTVAECPSGFGKTNVAVQGYEQCGLCPSLYFSLLPTSNECFSCRNVDAHGSEAGFNCQGGNTVTIDYNVWFSIVQNTELVSPLHYQVTQNDTIYTSQCPPQQCCQSLGGCSLLNQREQLCAMNRNISVPLCGLCKEGTYELFGTTACGNCSNTSNLIYLIPISIATLLFVIILLRDAKPSSDWDITERNYKKLVQNDEMRCLSIMISKIFMYYYQSLSQILYSKGIESAFSPVLTIFDLSFNFNNSTGNNSGFCIFPLIANPLMKIILNSVFVLFGLFHFIWIPFAIKWWEKCKERPIQNYTIPESFISVAALQLFIISCGTLLNVAFKLMSCITFPSKQMVHFYNPHQQCFGMHWNLGLFLLLFVVLSFMWIAYRIYKQTSEQRHDRQNMFRKMIKAYEPSAWWWEFVLFGRRITIALCTSIRNVNARDIDAILLVLLLIYLVWHVRVMPFKYTRLNRLEAVCLMVLILIFAVFRDDFTTKYTSFIDYFMAVAILLPLILVAFYIVKIILFVASSSGSKSYSETELHKIEKAKKRADVHVSTQAGQTKPIQIGTRTNEMHRDAHDDTVEEVQQDRDEIEIRTAVTLATTMPGDTIAMAPEDDSISTRKSDFLPIDGDESHADASSASSSKIEAYVNGNEGGVVPQTAGEKTSADEVMKKKNETPNGSSTLETRLDDLSRVLDDINHVDEGGKDNKLEMIALCKEENGDSELVNESQME